jgi:hypothetical protein
VKAQGSQQHVFPSTSRAKLLVIQGTVHLSFDLFFTDKFIESIYATLIPFGQKEDGISLREASGEIAT